MTKLQASSFWHKVWEEAGYPSTGVLATIKRRLFESGKTNEACFNLSALSYLWNAVAPYSTFRLRSLCVNGCLPRNSCVNGCLPNTLLTCQDVPGSHSAFLCRVKGHTLTSCARRRGSLGTRLDNTSATAETFTFLVLRLVRRGVTSSIFDRKKWNFCCCLWDKARAEV